jgi:NADP-dependent 3-hydroxy acid dehydrogenase YdfG
MSPALEAKKVTIITSDSGGIGAALPAAFRDTGYAVVGTRSRAHHRRTRPPRRAR